MANNKKYKIIDGIVPRGDVVPGHHYDSGAREVNHGADESRSASDEFSDQNRTTSSPSSFSEQGMHHVSLEDVSFLTKKRKRRKPFELKQRKKTKLLPAGSRKRAVIALVLIALAFIVGAKVLPRAVIAIVLERTSFSFEDQLIVSAEAYEALYQKGEPGITIPGEIIVASKNANIKFSTSGQESIEKPAEGYLYIFNEYSSAPQILVEKTRFLSPTGLVFRLNKRVTVPGAQIEDGKIVPSKIKVAVTANEPGETYNIPISDTEAKWTIPGFKEANLLDRYKGFYATPAGPFEGGFTGIAQVPTNEDIANAKNDARASITSALRNQTKITESPEWKLVEGAEALSISEPNINERADDSGNFSIFIEGELKQMVFEDELLKQIVADKFNDVEFDFEIVDADFIYNNVIVGWSEGAMTIDIKGSVTIKPSIDTDSLKTALLGQNESRIRATLFGVSGLERAQISLWPFWVKEVPNNKNKIDIELK